MFKLNDKVETILTQEECYKIEREEGNALKLIGKNAADGWSLANSRKAAYMHPDEAYVVIELHETKVKLRGFFSLVDIADLRISTQEVFR